MQRQLDWASVLKRGNQVIARHVGLAGTLLAFSVFVVFRRCLTGAFVFDDIPQILQNSYFARHGYAWGIFTGSTDPFPSWATHAGYYRPLEFLLYWAVDRLAGLHPPAFHLLQLVVYAATVPVLFLMGRELLENDLAALAGALLWGLHPLHVEVASWIASLTDAGATIFLLASFWLFLRAENAHHKVQPGEPAAAPPATAAWAGAALYLPALFFKEIALILPFLLAAYWFLMGRKESWLERAKRGWPYALVAGGYVAARMAVLGRFWTTAQTWKASARMAGVGYAALGQHAKLFFWPINLTPARTFEYAASLRSPWPWLTILALAATFALRKRQPRVAFLVAWWIITLLPCLDVRQLLGLPIQDNYSYLPSVGLCLAISHGALVLAPERLPQLDVAWAAVPAIVATLWTVQDVRNVPHWHDDGALWKHAVTAAPNSALAHLFAGIMLEHQAGGLDSAAREFQTALELNQASFRPTTGMVYECDMGLGRVALMKGKVPDATHYFNDAMYKAPTLSPAYRALGTLYFTQGLYEKSAKYFRRVVRLEPDDLEARFFLGTCWMKLNQPADAAKQFHAARELDPTYTQAYMAEAGALDALGDKATAEQVRKAAPKDHSMVTVIK